MGIEQKINYQLNKFPAAKRKVKRLYQKVMYTLSPKIKSEGDIIRISPDDPNHEYFFGYYDKSPWDATDRYMLCLRANNTWSDVSPKEKADILVIDTELKDNDPNRVRKVAETHAWNVQQSCMLQWLGPDFCKNIIYNDCRGGKYCSIILDLDTMEERLIPAPVYSVASDGKMALTLDFSRLYNLRPGYGYYNVPEKTEGIGLPDTTAIWKVDLESRKVTDLLKYTDFANFQPRPEMLEKDAVHKVNHIMLSPNGKRFMVLYRWFNGQRKYTRLITCNTDGTDMYVLSDDDMVSHCCWKNNSEILAFENKRNSGTGYYLMKDKSQKYRHCWPQFTGDGHPSYNAGGTLVVTDSYPNKARVASINLMNGDERQRKNTTVAKVFAPFKYDNDTRCDLHPRWNRKGDKICFDSVFEGHRGVYVVDISQHKETTNMADQNVKVSCVIPSYKRCDTVTRAIDSVLAQTYKNIEVCIVDDNIPGDEYSLRLQQALKKYEGDKRVRYIEQERHINGAVARNIGIEAAIGEYIGFLDDDDEWLHEKIEKQVAILENDSSIDAVTSLWVLYEGGKVIRKCYPYTSDNLQFKIFTRDVAVFTSTVLIKKDTIKKFGGFDGNLLRHQDLQFLISALSVCKFGVVQEYLVRLYGDSKINKPDLKKIIKTKKAFFKSVNREFERYSKCDRKRIINAHCYEVALQALSSRDIKTALKYLIKAGINIKSIQDLLKRYKERKYV